MDVTKFIKTYGHKSNDVESQFDAVTKQYYLYDHLTGLNEYFDPTSLKDFIECLRRIMYYRSEWTIRKLDEQKKKEFKEQDLPRMEIIRREDGNSVVADFYFSTQSKSWANGLASSREFDSMESFERAVFNGLLYFEG